MLTDVSAGWKREFAEMLDDYVGSSLPKRGELLQGTVISLNEVGLVVDVGMKRDGIVPHTDLELLEDDDRYSSGDMVFVMVTDPRDQDSNMVLSVFEARRNKDWIEADGLLESGDMWIGTPIGHNRGGLIVPFADIRGFLPASQVADLPRGLSSPGRQSYLEEMVGTEIGLKVIEVDRSRERLVFSQRDAQNVWRKHQRDLLVETLEVGQRLTGKVSGLRDFGAFVDLGGTDGLVHVSELSWSRFKHPSKVVEVGDQVDVKVIRIDSERKRIGLSIKELQPNPWERIREEVSAGQMISGRVTRIASFGAFVEVLGEVEGLLHNNQIPQEYSDTVVPGFQLELKVMHLDIDRQRIGLSLKDIPDNHTDSENYADGTRVTVKEENVSVDKMIADHASNTVEEATTAEDQSDILS